MLFARGNNGKILEWEMEVDDHRYRTIAGARDAKKVTSEWTICESKNVGRANETSGNEQAYAEAKSLWLRKIKRHGYWENEKDIDKTTFIEPMLALKFADHKQKLTYPVMVDRKFNGCRLVTSFAGMFTRKGEEYQTVPHIWKALKPLFDRYPDLVLDGELYNHDYRFKLNEIVKLIRKSKKFTQEDLDKSAKLVQYYVYDGYGFDNVSEETYCSSRRRALMRLLHGIPEVVVVPFEWAENESDVWKYYEEYLSDGYEGAIVRSDTKYEHRRTDALLKCKPSDDDEFVIIDIIEGTGNWSGAAKAVRLKYKDGNFKATVKGDREGAIQVLKDRTKWIGRTVTITYTGLTGLGTPHAAQMDPSNCFKGDR